MSFGFRAMLQKHDQRPRELESEHHVQLPIMTT